MNRIISRRSIRRYRPDAIPAELIDTLLTAASYAPSAHNRQPWRFVVMTSPETKRQLAASMSQKLQADLEADNVPESIITQDVTRSYDRFTKAPLLILLCLTMADMDNYPDPARQQHEWVMAVQSTAMAGQNLLLAAHEAGLGACWMCAPLFCPDVVRHTLALPPDWEPQALLTIGYPAEVKEKSRFPVATRVMYR